MSASAARAVVLALDDEPPMLVSLERLLRSGGYAVKCFERPEQLYAAGEPLGPACLLLDQHLGGHYGTDVHAELRRRQWVIPTIFLTADWDTHTVVQAMRGGADDYLTKPYDPDELLRKLEAALARSAATEGQRAEAAALRARVATLTPREREIVQLVVAGLLNKEIAAKLNLSLVTVKVYRGRAMQKLGARNPAQLSRFAAAAGLV